ncbi:MAG: hypothetical protein JXR88_09070 [Clostridia bacterium]|nr:hypothetical protein [Clostridia bacterium]
MKLQKGQWIYLIGSVLWLALLFHPNSGSLMGAQLSDLLIPKNWILYWSDVAGILILIAVGFILSLFYKKYSVYRKFYGLFWLMMVFIWSILSYGSR